MNTSLKDLSVIATGASSGIGWAIARVVYQEGAHVMLHERNAKSLVEKSAALGSRAHWVAADLADISVADTIAQACLDAFGRNKVAG